jgi:hypothetical protein
MADKIFTDWLIIKTITTQNGDFKKLSIKVEEFKTFLDTYAENNWVNINLGKSQAGKEYAYLDTWKPNENKKIEIKKEIKNDDDFISMEDIPFN